MSDTVVIPLPGLGTLQLPADVFAQYLQPVQPIAAPTPADAEPWLTSQQLADLTGIGDTTLEGWAKQGVIPCIRAGKALRFKASEVEAALRHADYRTATHLQAIDNAGVKQARNQKTTAQITRPKAGRYTRDTEGRV